MTAAGALPLLDLLQSSAVRGGDGAKRRLAKVADSLVESALDDFRHVEDLDRAKATVDPNAFDRNAAMLIRSLFDQWAAEAESLLDRIMPMCVTAIAHVITR